MAIPEHPYTRNEMYLNTIASGDSSGIPEVPYTRKEMYLNAIASGNNSSVPETPLTREELYLDAIAKGGGGGGGDTVEYKDVTFRCVNTTGSTTLVPYYYTEVSGVVTAAAVSMQLNTDNTIHVQVVNGNIQMFSQSNTGGWVPYYNGNPIPLLPGTNRSLAFALPPTYTSGEIITLQH